VSAPLYSLARKHRGGNTRLQKWDVAEIRRWARSEGFGLPVTEQIAHLQAVDYPTLGTETLRNVLRNESWYDPTYRPDDPLLCDGPSWVRPGTLGASWLVFFILMVNLWRKA